MNWRMMVPLTDQKITSTTGPFLNLQRQVNRMFDSALDDVPATLSGKSMTLDVKEDEVAYHVMTELPGLTKEDIDLSYDEGLLTIRGKKEVERDEKEGTWHITERSSGCFIRQLRMPTPVDSEKIEAKIEKGVLTVTLPKEAEEKSQAKKITVSGE